MNLYLYCLACIDSAPKYVYLTRFAQKYNNISKNYIYLHCRANNYDIFSDTGTAK